jgi:prepilin-type N-terminal cleavage/methylation domain-containing protein
VSRRGFTLVEVLVAIVLAGVVAVLVWSVMGAVADGRERVQRAEQQVRARAALRAVLQDALRHAVPPVLPGDTGLVLEDGVGGAGRPRDRLTFITAGGLPPLTADVQWLVVLEVSGNGLELRAVPRALAAATALTVRLPGVDALEVMALDDRGGWTPGWRGPGLPRGVAVVARAGAATVVPLVVALPAAAAAQ